MPSAKSLGELVHTNVFPSDSLEPIPVVVIQSYTAICCGLYVYRTSNALLSQPLISIVDEILCWIGEPVELVVINHGRVD